MSFNDLERGTLTQPSPALSASAQTDEERHYKRTVQEVSRKVFQINASVGNIRQQVGQLNTSRDTSRLRQDIQAKMETTRDLVKTTTAELKALSDFQQTNPNKRRARRLEQQKLTADFHRVVEQFQNIQRVSAEVTREFVDRARHAAHLQTDDMAEGMDHEENTPLLASQQQQQQQQRRVELSVLDNDIEYNEALINERESEINEIEQGIVELNEIFRDLGTIVTEQQSLLDNIETNVQSVGSNAAQAAEQLSSANEYQRRANKTKFCILLFLVIFVVVLILIAVS
ncbi:hypothetical protein LPJ78_004547 [Coemansia sp. RSA 989]|nr:t-SNARE [Coemansia mojavensis]KAJ1740204.1 hypothetical protein LPJ68_003994 [Coemansia sp. RSA 1086]KAJ1752448.1 hypothetical protein LPJ79_001195 [Coemansia sp. RSA 1821]KAJ1862712.1 hypothetical protein LPJ78_004547 [Coemansia sp. RSA 989]KAJ1874563.1 hypothetical protein LPJ55_001423 [Coemansia sp. RSA 990]KAJ2630092.1 hypothetical protein H4R22_002905 [Coemansia sp. RSA 1290]KAJ2648593.1 hypothetical protein IWW40_003779 [Coemansia sp. RSA 1250]KAJ2673292.1 hypothetical protein IWW42